MRIGDPDGHGEYGRLTHTDEGVICHECGHAFHQLATHVRTVHGYSSAAEYREVHGLRLREKLVSKATQRKMSERWEADREGRLKTLAEGRDVRKAITASAKANRSENWSPATRAARIAAAQAKRGRELTEDEKAYLSTDVGMEEWCRRAREVLQDSTVTAASMSRSLGLSASAVSQRLRRYP